MKVLMLSSDGSILDSASVSAKRMADYGSLADELHIIVLNSGESKKQSESIQLCSNVWVYPTNSLIKLLAPLNAYFIGKKLLRGQEFNVITCQDPFELGLIAWLLAKKFRPGLNAQIHGDFFGNSFWQKENILNRLRQPFGLFVLKRSQNIRVVSQRIKNSLIKFGVEEKKIIVAPIFTDIEQIQKTEPQFDLRQKYPESDLILLSIGNLVKVKNYPFALRAFKVVLENFPKAKYIIIGEGKEKNALKKLAEKLKISENVIFEGQKKDLISYYKTADIFLLTSNYEGWGRVIVEAAAAGLPIIMTDAGCAGEFIKDGVSGAVIAVGNKTGLIKAILQLAYNKDLKKRYVESARQALTMLPSKDETLKLIKESWDKTKF